jgi:hypothetical protein
MQWYRTLLAVGVLATTLVFPGVAQADTGSCPAPAGSYGGGVGSLLTPYQIATPGHLQRLRDDSPSWGSVFVVTANLDMTASGSTCTWESGIGRVGTPFSGIFYGNGHEIVDLNIAPPAAPVVIAGLFGVIANATLDGVDFSGNVTATAAADHQAIARAGGIVGLADGGSVVTDSSSAGTVLAAADDSVAPGDASASAGGLVGMLDGFVTVTGGSSSSTVSALMRSDDSMSTTAQGTSDAGGLVGTAAAGTTITDSSASGVVTAYVYYQSGISNGPVEARAGGLVGSSAGSTARSMAAGNAMSDASTTQMGNALSAGLIAVVASSGSVTDSYAAGISSATAGVVGGDALSGGLIGRLGVGATLASSYARGSVYATGGSYGSSYPGGLIGYNFGTITSAVAGIPQGPPTGSGSNAGITWTTAPAMQDIATYQAISWNIGNIWIPYATWLICTGVNSDYPFLASEYTADPGCSSNPGPGPTPDPAPEPELASTPRNATATAGDRSAMVSWEAPLSSGSFPVSHFLAISTPGAHTCLVAAPALTCEMTGLTNGTAYTFTVKALTGAGWSASSEPSNVVVPRASAGPSIVIAGARDGKRIVVSGSTAGFGMGAILNPWVRLAGQAAYSKGSAQVLVSMDGTFEWGRTTGKRTYVYMQTPEGSVRSNTVTIR